MQPTNPFDHSTNVNEPPLGTVLAWQKRTVDGTLLDYVSFRAGNGNWYTTGVKEQNTRHWESMLTHLRLYAHGPVRFALSWNELTIRVETENDPC